MFLRCLLPLAWEVWEEGIPAFGETALSLLFGFGMSLMKAMISGGILAGYYAGNLTRKAVNSLVWGRVLSLVPKGLLVFCVFKLLVMLPSPRNVYFLYEMFSDFTGDPA
ncbi:MAG: hypothetical protein OXF23_00045 [Candidatus Dadabacteria bacterium]|nr:hypothetical protein [Candidatus Dadabacteria bacterium]